MTTKFGRDITLNAAISWQTMGVIPPLNALFRTGTDYAQDAIGCPGTTTAGAACSMTFNTIGTTSAVALPIAIEKGLVGGRSAGFFGRAWAAGAPIARNVAWQLVVAQAATSPPAIKLYGYAWQTVTGDGDKAAEDHRRSTTTPQQDDHTYRTLNLLQAVTTADENQPDAMAPLVRAIYGCHADDWIICPGTPGHPAGQPLVGPYPNTAKPPKDFVGETLYRGWQLFSGDGGLERAINGCKPDQWVRCPTAGSAGIPKKGDKTVGPKIFGPTPVGPCEKGMDCWGRWNPVIETRQDGIGGPTKMFINGKPLTTGWPTPNFDVPTFTDGGQVRMPTPPSTNPFLPSPPSNPFDPTVPKNKPLFQF